MPKVYNYKKDGIPKGAVYVGRPSVFGNPFTVKDYGRGNALAEYEKWIWEPKQEKLRLKVMDELAGKDLVCWCAPEPCHAEVLMAIANAPQQLLDQYEMDEDETF